MSARGNAAKALGALFIGLVAISGVKDLRLYSASWATWGPLGPDEALPVFAARGMKGPDLDNAGLQGKVSLLAFWATWCGPCGTEMPTLQALHESYEGEPVQVIGINRDTDGPVPQLVEAYRNERGLSFPVVRDSGRMGQAFRVTSIPHIVIVDQRGKIRHVHQGTVSQKQLRVEIDALLAES